MVQAAVGDGALLTIKEAASRLGVCERTIFNMIASDSLRYVIVGTGNKKVRRRIWSSDLEAFIRGRTRNVR